MHDLIWRMHDPIWRMHDLSCRMYDLSCQMHDLSCRREINFLPCGSLVLPYGSLVLPCGSFVLPYGDKFLSSISRFHTPNCLSQTIIALIQPTKFYLHALKYNWHSAATYKHRRCLFLHLCYPIAQLFTPSIHLPY